MKKHTAEYLGGSRVRFTCKTCGRSFCRNLKNGPRELKRPMPPDFTERYVRFWNANGGASIQCKNCKTGEHQ